MKAVDESAWVEELDLEDKPVEEFVEKIASSEHPEQSIMTYRRMMIACKFLQRKIENGKDYKKIVAEKIDESIGKKEEQLLALKVKMKEMLLDDVSQKFTKTGGKSVAMPDVGTISLSKESEKINIVDSDKVMSQVPEDCVKIIKKLDPTKAKAFITESKKEFEGIEKTKSRTLRLSYK